MWLALVVLRMYPKGVSPKMLAWLPRDTQLNISFLFFCYTYFYSKRHNLIVLKNGLYHLKAKRINFHLVYIRKSLV